MEFFATNAVAIVFGLVIAGVILAYWLERKRRSDLEQLASSMGLRFSPEGPDLSSLENTRLDLFHSGHSRKAANLIGLSASGGQLRVFDYEYVTGSGKHSQTHHFTAARIAGGKDVPFFDLKPETLLHKVGELIGFKDIDLPAFPLFSEKYRLTGPEEAPVHMFFTPRRAAWFENNPGLRVQGAPGYVLLFPAGNGRLAVDKWMTFIEETKAFAAEVVR